MLRSKKDVDRHVRDILNKVKSESERKLRGYNIARFYHNVGEYEVAKRYLSEFLSVRPRAIDGHRLLGQIYEASGNKEKAVLSYKSAYELGDGQRDLVIKICELYSVVPCDASVRLYWAEEGQRLCPHHEAVTKLRTAIIARSADTSSRHSLQQLYLDEIKVNPTSSELQSNLVRLYLDWSKDEPRKLDEAYNYVAEVEARRPFTHSLTWYQTMMEVAEAYEKRGSPQSAGTEFHTSFVTGLERLVHLTLEAASNTTAASDSNKTHAPYLTEAANLLRRFDSKLSSMKKVSNDKELEKAMLGQLFFHIAQYLMITAKKSSSPLSPNTLSCLLLHACRFQPAAATDHYHKLACYRLSQSTHILHNIARDTNTTISTMLNKVRQQCNNRETKEEVFRAVFGDRASTENSYFLHHSDFVEAELALPQPEDVRGYDQVVSMSECSQLREIVWLCLQEILLRSSTAPAPTMNTLNLSNLNSSLNTSSISSGNNLNVLVKSVLKGSQPYYPYKLFEGLQFASSHLSSAVPDSLCHLDLLAFLAATVYCQLETGVCSSNVRSAVCKTSVCSGWLLHSEQQGEWWTAAHSLYSNSSRQSALAKGLGKARQVVQRGLEAVRLLSGGGVSLPLALHLAQCFTHWAATASTDSDGPVPGVSISDVTALEERAEHCWHQVLASCGKSGSSGSTHTPRNKIFVTSRHELPAGELETVEEEGRLFLAKRLIKAGRRQEALQALGQLRSPDAAFQRAMVYKQQANEMTSAVGGDVSLLTPEQRGQHTLFLTQARDTLYLTLDRLRMPAVDRNHPLNSALSQELTIVERALTTLTVDDHHHLSSSYLGDGADNSVCDPLSPIRHTPQDLTNGHEGSLDVGTTPFRDNRATSTFRRLEARPSPERLDAQVRHLTSVQEQTLQNLAEQNAALRTHNTALRDTCNTMATQVHENTQLFKSILEQNKTMSLDCYNNILSEIKQVQPALRTLQDDVLRLKSDVVEIKNMCKKRAEEAESLVPEQDQLPGHLTAPTPHQRMLYMGYYGNQVGAHVPHPLAPHPHMVPPPSSMFGGHHPPHPQQSPFMPPATLADLAYLAASSNSQRLLTTQGGSNGLEGSGSAAATVISSPSVSARPALHPLLAQHMQQQDPSVVPVRPPMQQHPLLAQHMQQQQPDPSVPSAVTAHYAAAAAIAAGDVTEAGQPSGATGGLMTGGFSGLMPPIMDIRPSAATSVTSAAEKAAAAAAAMAALSVSSVMTSAGVTGSIASTAPHNYQIPLPASLLSSVTPPRHHTPERTPGVGLLTSGLLAGVPAPLYSAVTPDSSPLRPPQQPVPSMAAVHASRFSSPAVVAGSPMGAGASPLQTLFMTSGLTPAPATPAASAATPTTPLTGKVKTYPQRSQVVDDNTDTVLNSSAATTAPPTINTSNEYYPDDDHDPCPDFKPVVPLPEKVDVCTGEEDEQVLFEDRAKLYRMVAKEWKERGTGVLKILHHAGKRTLRILMRRDQTHKICSNHFITSGMELKKQPKNDSVWIWGAQDFADEELRTETFCCRFKTAEVALKFSQGFTEATQLAAEYEKEATSGLATPTPDRSSVAVAEKAVNSQPLSELFKRQPGTWACDTCLVNNKPEAAACVACCTPNPAASAAAAGPDSKDQAVKAPTAGGFKFGLPSGTSVTSSPSFSSLPPAKASGSITFGMSGQVGSSKPSLFGTPTSSTSGLFSTPTSSKGGMFSTPSTGAAFSTPSSTLAPPAASAAGGMFSTPTTGGSSIFGTPHLQTPSATTSIFGTPLLSDPVSGAVDLSSASSTSLFSTPSAAVTTSTVGFPASTSVADKAPTSTTTQSKIAFGGFSFTTAPSIVPSPDKTEVKAEKEEPKKESIFSSFTFGSTANSSGGSSAFSFSKKEEGTEKSDSKPSVVSGMFSNANTAGALTFGAVAGSSPGAAVSDVFKTKDSEAFKPQPLFGGVKSANTTKNTSTAAGDESSDKVDEYEPEVHFEPVIPLPELVQVKTGEEDEEQLFCERAKLYRYAEATKEWKERGLGEIKVLSNSATGKLRVLMRREKTLKICANHYITPELKMTVREDSEKAMSWVANDFADGEMVKEKFTVRFKNADMANAFKEAFEKAQEMAKKNTDGSSAAAPADNDKVESLADKFKPAQGSWECEQCLVRNEAQHSECLACKSAKPGAAVPAKPAPAPLDAKTQSLAAMFKPAAGSWECDVCLVRNTPDVVICASCSTLKTGATPPPVTAAPKESAAFGAAQSTFSFGISSASATPAQSAAASSAAVSSSGFTASAFKFGTTAGASATFSFGLPAAKPDQAPASPASYSFKPQASKETSAPKSPSKSGSDPFGFQFGSPEKFEFSFNPKAPRSRDVSQCESEDGVVEEDEGDHLYFEPVVPLPDKVEVVTGEENEEVLYSHRAKLFRKAGVEWKERGLGDVKVLRHRHTRRVRLLMRREQVHKICLNHYLTKDIEFHVKDDKSFYWVAQDYSDDSPSMETLAIRFKSGEIAQEFKLAALAAQSGASDSPAKDGPPSAGGSTETPAVAAAGGAEETLSRVERARRLQLPDDFFNYEDAQPCPGCVGCRDDDAPSFLQPETPLGNVLKDFPRDSSDPPSLSAEAILASTDEPTVLKPVFGGSTNTTSGSPATLSFGAATPRSLFGGGPANAITSSTSAASTAESSSPSVFTAVDKTATSVFGSSMFSGSPAATTGSTFGSSTAPKTSLFGTPGSTSLFGAASSTTPSRSLFGDTPTSSISMFGGAAKSGTSLFGGTPNTAAKSMFGGTATTTATTSMFGGTATTTATTSMFSGTATTTATTSMFGGSATSSSTSLFGGTPATSTSSLFGGGATSAPSSTSLFGGSSSSTSSIFGGSSATTSSSVFASSPSVSRASIFGGSPAPPVTSSSVFGGGSSVFGGASSAVSSAASKTTSLFSDSKSFSFTPPSTKASNPSTEPKFGEPASTGPLFSPATSVATSIFGGAVSASAAPGSLFGGASSNSNASSFASFADITSSKEGTIGFSNKGASDPAWKPKPLFTSLNTSSGTKQSAEDSSDQLHQEDEDAHDPHFEPVIPMPDLVEVKTGEEGLEVIYCHRSKTFRYENATKEWKERGLGDIKILYDPANKKYRLLQRREQIHKLAMHHYILPGQKLTPMATSETAWCWFAQDFSEDPQGSRQQLAARFKTPEIAKDFKEKFEECVRKAEELAGTNSSMVGCGAAGQEAVQTPSKQQPLVQQYVSESESDSDEDEDDDEDDDYVDSTIMFEKTCNLEKRLGENWDDLGLITLRIVYESDAEGVRLMATDDDTETLLVDHLIIKGMQYSDQGETGVTWSALDLTTHPACMVKLRVNFDDVTVREEFCVAFDEGRELADVEPGTYVEDIHGAAYGGQGPSAYSGDEE